MTRHLLALFGLLFAASASGVIYFHSSGVSAPTGAPGSFAAVEQNGAIDLTWDAVTGADDYDVDFRLSTDTIWTDDSQEADLAETVGGLTNDVMYDLRVAGCNGAGCGPYSQLDDVTPSVLARLLRTFSGGHIYMPKRIDGQWEDTARTDQVDITGDKILHSDNFGSDPASADGWIQATAGDEPDWDSDDGSYWNGDTNGDVHMDYDVPPSYTGDFLLCWAYTLNNSNNFFKYLRDGAQNALRRQSSDGSTWRLYTGTNRDITFSTTPSKGGDASTYAWNITCIQRSSDTLTAYLQRIGTDPNSPTDSTWASVGTLASATGNWEPDVLGNESGTGAPEGHIAGLMHRNTAFTGDTERNEVFEDLLNAIKL